VTALSTRSVTRSPGSTAPGSPVAVLDYGGYAAEPMVFVLAAGPDRLVRRTDAILDAMDGTG
jgi:predicted fused transcriptional regulator/phosphomethylpyrimidine kinase